jgi:hypothetical protein
MRVYPPKVISGAGVGGSASHASGREADAAWFQGGNSCAEMGRGAVLQHGARCEEQYSLPQQQQQQQQLHVTQPCSQHATANLAPLYQATAVPPLPLPLPLPLAFSPSFFSPMPSPPLSPSVSSLIAHAARSQRSLEQVGICNGCPNNVVM